MKTMNHTEYQKQLQKKPTEALYFIIQDCQEALNAMPDNPNTGYYMDEINYCSMELKKRETTKRQMIIATDEDGLVIDSLERSEEKTCGQCFQKKSEIFGDTCLDCLRKWSSYDLKIINL